jgi:hypothetical protein
MKNDVLIPIFVGIIILSISFSYILITTIKNTEISDLNSTMDSLKLYINNLEEDRESLDKECRFLDNQTENLDNRIKNLSSQLEKDKFWGKWISMDPQMGLPRLIIFNRDNSMYYIYETWSSVFYDKYWFDEEFLYYNQTGSSPSFCSYEFVQINDPILYKDIELTFGLLDGTTIHYTQLQ